MKSLSGAINITALGGFHQIGFQTLLVVQNATTFDMNFQDCDRTDNWLLTTAHWGQINNKRLATCKDARFCASTVYLSLVVRRQLSVISQVIRCCLSSEKYY